MEYSEISKKRSVEANLFLEFVSKEKLEFDICKIMRKNGYCIIYISSSIVLDKVFGCPLGFERDKVF